jgi:hypothetical protein
MAAIRFEQKNYYQKLTFEKISYPSRNNIKIRVN